MDTICIFYLFAFNLNKLTPFFIGIYDVGEITFLGICSCSKGKCRLFLLTGFANFFLFFA